MIIADENIDHSIIEAIRSIGIEVISVYESNRGIRDEQILALSRVPPRLILTEDKDFGEWVFAHNVRDVSVVFLRYAFQETPQISELVCTLPTHRLTDLIGCFTTITTQKIRIRRIQPSP